MKRLPHLTMEVTKDQLPSLPSKAPNNQINTQTTLGIGHFSGSSMDQSPAINSNKPSQTDFSEDNPNTPTLTTEQRNAVILVCRELQEYSLRDVTNCRISTSTKREE